MHTAISSHTPPGQGDLGRETVVGSTPSTPMMAHITKWEPSSLPFPHAYTPLRCCRRPPSASSGGAIPSAVVHVRAELFARARPAAIGRQVRRARAPPARTSCRTHPRLGALLGRPACVPGPCTQSTVFNIPACPCAQEASSTYILSFPNGRRRLWQVQVCSTPRCAWLAPSPSPRRSHLLARRRTARDSLNGIGRARAASMLSRHELSHRAFFPACTFGLRCRGLWQCLVVVSCCASE